MIFTGKITRASLESYAKEKGWESVQIDGTPDGFAWKQPDININCKEYPGKIIKFKPLGEWDRDITYE